MDFLVPILIILLSLMVALVSTVIGLKAQEADSLHVNITSPNPCEDIPGPKEIIVQGTASDQGSGIEKVEAFAHTLPFNNQFPYEIAEQINNNWSNWKIKLSVPENEPYRISARVTDMEGNENWDEVTITTRPEIAPETNDTKIRVAFIHPTFTSTAYSPDSFYTFYAKYQSASETTDIGLLNTELNLEENRTYYQPFIDSFRKHLPHTSISILRDQDVHNNAIFLADNQTNAFNVVALLHNEYVTEKEYYNLKKFVENGGTLILIDGNVFYAEVSYDPKNCSIQLVEGHDWVVANGTAEKGPHERWLKENREWIGSNFLYGDIAEPVKYMNNPFNYTRFEENYISNNNATILLDYLAEIPANVLNDNNLTTTPPVATYELFVGNGKVVAVGLYGQNLAFNEKFLDFFKKTVIQHAVGNHKVFDYEGNKFLIYWNAPGNITDISVDKASKSISLTYISPEKDRNLNSNNSLALSLPRKLIDSPDTFGITINNQVLGVNASRNGVENIIDIPIDPGHNAITIKGKAISPSFSIVPPSDIVVNATGKETHLTLSPPAIKSISAKNYSITNDAPEAFPWGDTLVNWTVTQDAETAYEQQKITILDNLSPSINITSPNLCEDIPGPEEIIVQGSASDQGSGIEKVEAFAHTLPFNNQFPYEIAERINNNWSSWKIKLSVPENEPYRISARVTDMEGNENWDEVTITTRPEIAPETNDTKTRVAFIHPSFTSTAYSPDSFYTFYPKYESVSETTADIGLLNTELNLEENRTYYQPFIDSFSKHLPHTSISILRDQDVHNNAIFLADNQTNAFNAVALLHNEYVTEKEYYNLKKFVENGGTLILIDGNVFYAEVRYDPKNCSIQLVEGHDWVVANGTAKKGPHERWLKENREWIGSNFLYGDIAEPVKYMNNPFNYTRFEENYISNNNATILLDYLAEIPANVLNDNNLTTTPPVATYELSVGEGKVVAVGLYGQNLAFNDKFLDFFKKTVIQHAVGNHKVFDYAGNKFLIYWNAPGNISDISVDKASKSISLTYISPEKDRNLSSNNSLALSLPRKLIDSPDTFGITINNQVLGVNASRNGVENILDIPTDPGHNAITIKGKAITPSFSMMPPSDIVMNATGKETHLRLSPPTIKSISTENYSITNDAPEAFAWGDTLVNWTVTQDGETAYEQQKITILDNLSPSINITFPNLCEDIPGPKEIIVQGTASDQGSGIEKVEAFAHTLPFNNQFPYEIAEQINNNWSNWKIKLNVPENEPYRISARVTDMEGNENWDAVVISLPTNKCKNNIP